MRKSLLILTLTLIAFGEKTITTTVSLAEVPTQETTSQVDATTEPDIVGTWKSTGTNVDEIAERIETTHDLTGDLLDEFNTVVSNLAESASEQENTYLSNGTLWIVIDNFVSNANIVDAVWNRVGDNIQITADGELVMDFTYRIDGTTLTMYEDTLEIVRMSDRIKVIFRDSPPLEIYWTNMEDPELHNYFGNEWRGVGTNIDDIVNRILSTQDIPQDLLDDFQEYVARQNRLDSSISMSFNDNGTGLLSNGDGSLPITWKQQEDEIEVNTDGWEAPIRLVERSPILVWRLEADELRDPPEQIRAFFPNVLNVEYYFVRSKVSAG